jgi:hypothetical protein
MIGFEVYKLEIPYVDSKMVVGASILYIGDHRGARGL